MAIVMRTLFGFLLIFFAIGAVLIGIGAGVGFLLHWIVPSVDIGVGILIGVVTIGFTAQLFARVMALPLSDSDDEPYVEPAPRQRITYLIDPTPPRRRGRRKPS